MSETGRAAKKQFIDEFISNITPKQGQMVICFQAANEVLGHEEPCVCDDCKKFAYYMAKNLLAEVFETADDETATRVA